MKVIQTAGTVTAVLVVMFFGISFFLPPRLYVERSLVIPGSAKNVFHQINDLRQWKNWSPWYYSGPEMEIVFEDYLSGTGATYRWSGHNQNNGKLTITDSEPYEKITATLFSMYRDTATVYYYFEPVNEGTKVTWIFISDSLDNSVEKYRGLLTDGRIGNDFEEGLARLKKHVKGR